MRNAITTWSERPWGAPWKRRSDILEVAKSVSEIGIERSMCFGPCPVYRVTLRRGGHSEYLGEHFVFLAGRHTAAISADDFEMLALALLHLGFLRLEREYPADVTCHPTTTMWLAHSGGVHRVEDYAASGPKIARVAEALIDDAAASLPWQPTGTDAARPFFIDPDARHWTQQVRD